MKNFGFSNAKNTDELSDIYGAWLEANGFEGDEPAEEVMALHCDKLAAEHIAWLSSFMAAFKAMEEKEAALARGADPHAICAKWIRIIGIGFHPDTRGKDYSPALSAEQIAEYDADMRDLFAVAADPYECGTMAMADYGLI